MKQSKNALSVKKIAALVTAVLLIVLLIILYRFFIRPKGEPADPPEQTAQIGAELEEQIVSALRYRYLNGMNDEIRSGEYYAEAHRVLGAEEREGKTVVYAIVSETDFGFVNGYFTDVSGSSCIPTVLSLAGEPEKTEILTPQDGALFDSSVRDLFPEKIAKTILRDPGKYGEELWEKMARDAADYLRSIGREAEVKRMYEAGTSTLTDHGVSVEVSNALAEDGGYDRYPFYGTSERIENGVRYVYGTSYDDVEGHIVYEKYPFGGDPAKTAVERFVVDASNGSLLERFETPSVQNERLVPLAETYPALFTMDPADGFDVYIWQAAENVFYGWIFSRAETPGESVQARLMRVYSALEPEDIKELLSFYGMRPEQVNVVPYTHPLSSFIGNGLTEKMLREKLGPDS